MCPESQPDQASRSFVLTRNIRYRGSYHNLQKLKINLHTESLKSFYGGEMGGLNILSMFHLEFNSTFEIDKTWDKLWNCQLLKFIPPHKVHARKNVQPDVLRTGAGTKTSFATTKICDKPGRVCKKSALRSGESLLRQSTFCSQQLDTENPFCFYWLLIDT